MVCGWQCESRAPGSLCPTIQMVEVPRDLEFLGEVPPSGGAVFGGVTMHEQNRNLFVDRRSPIPLRDAGTLLPPGTAPRAGDTAACVESWFASGSSALVSKLAHRGRGRGTPRWG
jgi:hypothetical protein